LKQLVDQGDAIAQYHCGLCLLNGKSVSIDLRSAAQCGKLSADQEDINRRNIGRREEIHRPCLVPDEAML
jgi:hypothetical protein